MFVMILLAGLIFGLSGTALAIHRWEIKIVVVAASLVIFIAILLAIPIALSNRAASAIGILLGFMIGSLAAPATLADTEHAPE